MILKILNIISLRPMIRIIVEIPKILAIHLDPICESCCHQGILAHSSGVREHIFFVERPSSGIAGWRKGWIADIRSEGTRPAPLPAGPVPERWNVKSVFIETPHGQRLTGRACSAVFLICLARILSTVAAHVPKSMGNSRMSEDRPDEKTIMRVEGLCMKTSIATI